MTQQDRPTMATFGTPITSDDVKEVWEAFVTPEQDEDRPQSAEMRTLIGILRWTNAKLEALEAEEADAEEADAEEAETGDRPPHAATMHVRVKPVIDEDEWEAALETATGQWDRRLEVVRTALSMLPAPGKRGGLAAAFAGEEIEDPLRVENALKIARFAADEDRDIPGVDR